MIIKGPYPDVEIPETALTPFVMHRAQELADKPALIDGPTGRAITFAQFSDAIAIVAHNLAQRGFSKGQVIGILSPNCPEYGIAFHTHQPALHAHRNRASTQRRRRAFPDLYSVEH